MNNQTKQISILSSNESIHGSSYILKYIGYVEFKSSIFDLEIDAKNSVVQEAIRRVVEKAKNIKILTRPNNALNDENVKHILGNVTVSEWKVKNVKLHINTSCFRVSTLDDNQTILEHSLDKISYARRGNPNELIQNFVAYVAKDKDKSNKFDKRACYVFDCENIAETVQNMLIRMFYQRSSSEHNISCKDLNMLGRPWYHGKIERERAENLLTKDGDFLVRESSNGENQYVLSVRYNCFQHILLVGKEGLIKTQNLKFDSIDQFIEFHHQNKIPISYEKYQFVLKFPVIK